MGRRNGKLPVGNRRDGKSGGRVRCLQDLDGDGNTTCRHFFADGLSFPTGVLAWGKGILVTAAQEIVYLENSTNDGKVIYSGFLERNHHHY